ncbi:auxin-responsive protein SAUR71-like [Phalaenopsis equestris]|uniref:auxin-responsive protein SAUR71-like n=1 Tax=Phalaenopsis equestris TaxID=78828 RepID=UPI0009E22071|nr:auxin-responsive protein SAUR71-like [Phalaenopsis equestris]
MRNIIQRLLKFLDITRYERLKTTKIRAGGIRRRLIRWRSVVPPGHLPVFVGEEMELFAVAVELLGRPAFTELLRRSAEEYGYEHTGVLRIPCSVQLFCSVLRSLSGKYSGDKGKEGSL